MTALEHPKISRIESLLWGAAFYCLTTPFTFFLLGVDPAVGSETDVLTRRGPEFAQLNIYLLRFAVLGFALLGAARHWRSLLRRWGTLLPIFPFLTWATLSMFWTDSVESTRNALVALFAIVLTIYVAAARLSLQEFARALLWAITILATTSLLTVMFIPDIGVHQTSDAAQWVHAGKWRGAYMHKNVLGPIAAISLAGLIVAKGPLGAPMQKWPIVLLLAALIIFSGSASALPIVPIAIILGYVVVRLAPVFKIVTLIMLFFVAVTGGLILSQILAALGRDVTLSGRTAIWKIALEFIEERPLIGYGFQSLSYGGFGYASEQATGIGTAHNGFVDLILGTGLIGLLLFCGAVAPAWYAAYKHSKFGPAQETAALVLCTTTTAWLLGNLTESAIQALAPTAGLGLVSMLALLLSGTPSHAVNSEAGSRSAGDSHRDQHIHGRTALL